MLLATGIVHGQHSNLTGIVISADDDQPLIGANVQWAGTNIGAPTDESGRFEIERTSQTNLLVISYIGYSNDTIEVSTSHDNISINLSAGQNLEQINVVYRRKATEYSLLDPIKVEKINEKELLKAACCNLSESFETNPSVDVAFTDAITGTRQIEMLGLSGPYIQINRENMPYVRGLAAVYGLTFVPGTWVEGMQLNKGTGSVLNGFESMAGQINVELRKPQKSDRLYLNLYANEGSRLEANANISHKFNDQWSSALLLHAKRNQTRMDRNNDSFMDMPLGNNLIALNRWQYIGEDGLRVQFGINVTGIENVGGQVDYKAKNTEAFDVWGLDLDLNRIDGWFKFGKVYEHLPWRSWAMQMSGSHHEQNSRFGLKSYDARHRSFYTNLLYQSIIRNTHHKILVGASLQHDNYIEQLDNRQHDRVESVPGAFAEYTFAGSTAFTAVAGLRADVHNIFGFFMTPRLHVRYTPSENLVMRTSFGRGQRTANIIAENNRMLASSRRWIIPISNSNKPYGLDPEVSWNAGANFIYSFQNGQHPGSISLDLYRTYFQNQIVIDLENPRQVEFYNLEGRSFSNSLQLQVDYELHDRLDVRLAYRLYDVKSTYDGQLLERPMVSKHRMFVNLAYNTENDWSFDLTTNWQGQKRLPSTLENAAEYRLSEYSPDFAVLNAQISKKWNDTFEVYLGTENLLNFRQTNPILASDDPFGDYFDATFTWGPIFGRNIYVGWRYRI